MRNDIIGIKDELSDVLVNCSEILRLIREIKYFKYWWKAILYLARIFINFTDQYCFVFIRKTIYRKKHVHVKSYKATNLFYILPTPKSNYVTLRYRTYQWN